MDKPIHPKDLPEVSDSHPVPWRAFVGGNGHYFVDDVNGQTVCHVYCWDLDEYKLFWDLLKKLKKRNGML